MYLIGASGHAKVVIDCLRDAGVTIQGLFDANPGVKNLKGYDVKGDYTAANQEEPLVISIGANSIRQKIAESLKGRLFGKAIHPSALISSDVTLGDGTVVFHGAVIQSSSKIGKHVIVNTAASIDHDCIIGDFAHIAPQVTLCGNVTVGEGTLVGAGSVVIPGIKIGKWSVIGAGSSVFRDVPDYGMVIGNPARLIKYTNE
ncbi:MAG: acetyltransferase [Cytophagaceae bacterium]|jgi:acetyltransferase EpsM|nr:acetyltransferase [Cytophagaceae bacterium]